MNDPMHNPSINEEAASCARNATKVMADDLREAGLKVEFHSVLNRLSKHIYVTDDSGELWLSLFFYPEDEWRATRELAFVLSSYKKLQNAQPT